MAIAIPHRFIQRLVPPPEMKEINYVIIGTFNPGEPDISTLNGSDAKTVTDIFSGVRYKRFSQVLNFYDRPPNRFWGVLDRLYHPDIYLKHGMDYKHKEGLKHYRLMDRGSVLRKQTAFCAEKGLFITDLVRKISTDNVLPVYYQFRDSDIDKSVTEWNTSNIIQVIQQYQPAKVFFNFKASPAIPAISRQMALIQASADQPIHYLPSSSGAAGYTYTELVKEWGTLILND